MRALGFTSKYLGNFFFVERTEGALSISANTNWSPDDLESWLAEGLAQYGAERSGADHWDSHRDMLERVAWLSGAIQPLPKLAAFTGDSRESEGIYNQGYSFIRFVMSNGVLDLKNLLQNGHAKGIRGAIEMSMNMTIDNAFAAWQNDLRIRHGNPDPAGLMPQSWLMSPKRLDYLRSSSPVQVGDDRYFLSSHQNDYGATSLFHQDAAGYIEKLATETEGRIEVDTTRNRLLFIRLITGLDRRNLRELFSLNFVTGDQQQLTAQGRLVDMASTEQGVFYIGRKEGHNRLFRLLEPSNNAEELLVLPYEYELISVSGSSIPGQL
jgi:hypothetical protein